MIERTDHAQYNTGYDSQRFIALMAQSGTDGFDQKLQLEIGYIRQQLKTDIGERLGVASSTYRYDIRDGKLYEPGRDIPFEVSIEGDWEGRKPGDLPRERAEVAVYKRLTQGYLAHPETPDGSRVVDFSPQGFGDTNYTNNYLDVHERVGNQVISTRYVSNLSNAQYREKILAINPAYAEILPENPSDLDLKKAALIIPSHLRFESSDDLAKFFLKEKKGMPEEILEQIWIGIAPIYTSFINTLVENPEALEELETNYIAMQKAAVLARELERPEDFYSLENMALALERVAGKKAEHLVYSSEIIPNKAFDWAERKIVIEMIANQGVEVSGGGCGSGACSTGESSVLEDIGPRDEKGKLSFHCPACGEENTRPYGGYVLRCQNKNCSDPEAVLPPFLKNQFKFN